MLRGPIPKRRPKLPLVQPAWQVAQHPVLAFLSKRYPGLWGRLPTCYSPVRRSSTPEGAFPLDLHVLSTPPAFVLSQDQTLRDNLVLATRGSRDKRWKSLCSQRRGRILPRCRAVVCRPRRAGRAAMLEPHDGVIVWACWHLAVLRRTGVHRQTRETGRAGFHAVQFSKTACHVGTWCRPLTQTRPRVVGPEPTVASVSLKHGCESAYRSTPHVLGVDCVRAIPLCGTPYITQTAVPVSRARTPLVIVPTVGTSGQPRGLGKYTQCFSRVNLLPRLCSARAGCAATGDKPSSLTPTPPTRQMRKEVARVFKGSTVYGSLPHSPALRRVA